MNYNPDVQMRMLAVLNQLPERYQELCERVDAKKSGDFGDALDLLIALARQAGAHQAYASLIGRDANQEMQWVYKKECEAIRELQEKIDAIRNLIIGTEGA